MKPRSRGLPLERAGDTAAMTEAVKALLSWGYRPERPDSKYQVKINDLSYYPDKGTMNFDGRKSEPDKGLEALKEVLARTRGRLALADQKETVLSISVPLASD